jgi:hypothetical protein
MSDKPTTTLDDFRIGMDAGRVILQMVVLADEVPNVDFVKVGMATDEARELASHLIERAERVERERS